MYIILFKNTTSFDFGRETCMDSKLHKRLLLAISEWFYLSDHSIQVKNNKNRPLGLSKG